MEFLFKDFITEIGPYYKNTSDILLPQRKANFNRESMKSHDFDIVTKCQFLSLIRSLPVTKKSAKFVAGNRIYDIFQRHYMCYEMDFLSLQRNLSLESNLNFLWNAPPGLVVTRASCYSCVFSKTRRQQDFSVMSDEKHFKPTLHAKLGDHIRQ